MWLPVHCFLFKCQCKLHVIKMQLCCPTKSPALCEDVDLYADFNMDEMDLSLENYEELFGVALNNPDDLFENGAIDSLFGAKDMSGTESNCQGAVAAEVLFSYLLFLCGIFNSHFKLQLFLV